MKRIFSGIKPTGELHLGNYLGAIKNWLTLQNEYECIFGIVDFHAMTTAYEKEKMEEFVLKGLSGYLACGLDPEKSLIMVQSLVPQVTELSWILNCITPISWLERVPTYKEKSQQQSGNINMGLLDYPVLMTADIIIYKANAVPVGEDQLPHIELSREIIRKFNSTFGEIFPEPKGIVGQGARVKGLDGSEKMGKSLDNCICLSESEKDIWKKISKAVTDPARIRRTDPGNPEICNVYSLHKLFTEENTCIEISDACRSAQIGCVDCKKKLSANINNELMPIRDKYNYYLENKNLVRDILQDGSRKAFDIAEETMREVRDKTGIKYHFLKNI